MKKIRTLVIRSENLQDSAYTSWTMYGQVILMSHYDGTTLIEISNKQIFMPYGA